MLRKEFKAFNGRYFSMIGEILLRPEAMDLREEIARFNSVMLKLLVRICGEEGYGKCTGQVSVSEGT